MKHLKIGSLLVALFMIEDKLNASYYSQSSQPFQAQSSSSNQSSARLGYEAQNNNNGSNQSVSAQSSSAGSSSSRTAQQTRPANYIPPYSSVKDEYAQHEAQNNSNNESNQSAARPAAQQTKPAETGSTSAGSASNNRSYTSPSTSIKDEYETQLYTNLYKGKQSVSSQSSSAGSSSSRTAQQTRSANYIPPYSSVNDEYVQYEAQNNSNNGSNQSAARPAAQQTKPAETGTQPMVSNQTSSATSSKQKKVLFAPEQNITFTLDEFHAYTYYQKAIERFLQPESPLDSKSFKLSIIADIQKNILQNKNNQILTIDQYIKIFRRLRSENRNQDNKKVEEPLNQIIAKLTDLNSSEQWHRDNTQLDVDTQNLIDATTNNINQANRPPAVVYDNLAQRPEDTVNNRIYNQFIQIINTAHNNDNIRRAMNALFTMIVGTHETDLDSLARIIHDLYNVCRTKEYMHPDILHELQKFITDIRILREERANDPVEKANDDADLLIAQSYITPEMQYAVLSYVDNNLFMLNVVTGKVQNIPSVYRILRGKRQSKDLEDEPNPYIDSTDRTNALHAALEAIRIAKFVAGLNVAYAQPEYVKFAPTISSTYLMPPIDANLIQALNNREKEVTDALGHNSIWAWIPTWSSLVPTSLINMFTTKNQTKNHDQHDHGHLNFRTNLANIHNYPDNFVAIPDKTIQAIMKNFDYKQSIDPKKAADLLCKQCFLAQQIFAENDWPLYCTPERSPISASNYIFNRLQVTPNRYAQDIDQLCNCIKTAVITKTYDPTQAHVLLLRVRKAIQTAMFIANKNSSVNAWYVFPSSVTKYLDSVLNELNAYDTILDNLCQDPKLGAQAADQARRNTWNAISNIVTAGVKLGIIAGGAFAIYSGIKSVNKYAGDYFAQPQSAVQDKKEVIAPAVPPQPAVQDKKVDNSSGNPTKSQATSVDSKNVQAAQIPVSHQAILNIAYQSNSTNKPPYIPSNQGFRSTNSNNLQQTDTENQSNANSILNYIALATGLADVTGDIMSSDAFNENRKYNYDQATYGDAEMYGLSGYSHNDAIGAAAVTGVGSIAKTAYNVAKNGINSMLQSTTTNVGAPGLANAPTAGGIGATMAGTSQKSQLNNMQATFADGVYPNASTSTKIIEANIPRASFASAEPYRHVTTTAPNAGVLAEKSTAGAIGATIAGTERLAPSASPITSLAVIPKTTPIGNLPKTTQTALATGLIAASPVAGDIASDAATYTDDAIHAMQPVHGIGLLAQPADAQQTYQAPALTPTQKNTLDVQIPADSADNTNQTAVVQ